MVYHLYMPMDDVIMGLYQRPHSGPKSPFIGPANKAHITDKGGF
jgi:hypothetical protein